MASLLNGHPDGGPAYNAKRRAQIEVTNQLVAAVRYIMEQTQVPGVRLLVARDPLGLDSVAATS